MARAARRRLLALCLLGSLTLLAATAAHAASPVWVVRGPNSTVYLAGSVHLLPTQDAVLPPAFERAYGSAAKVVMELDLGKLDPLEMAAWILEHGSLPAGTTLREVVGAPRYARVSAAASDLGLTPAVLDAQAPWVVEHRTGRPRVRAARARSAEGRRGAAGGAGARRRQADRGPRDTR